MKADLLRTTSFGASVAEYETNDLSSYFVQTDQWQRIFSGQVDIVYGAKGSGKSAIYSVLLSSRGKLFDRSILITPAENPRGSPAFADLIANPPASEEEFRALWKAYFLSLTAAVFRTEGITNSFATSLISTLQGAQLLPNDNNLRSFIRAALDWARTLVRLESVEGGIKVNPVTGQPQELTGKVTLREPSQQNKELGYISLDALFALANRALEQENFRLWIVLDRLDVAFTDNIDLEENALRALFKVYLDLLTFDRIALKIFLRTDIWRRITGKGFREASHITRHITIEWNQQSLMNLVIRRVLKNKELQEYYGVDSNDVLSSSQKQQELFYRVFPDKVDLGDRKPRAFDWMLIRTRDGTKQNAPRELIHLLSSMRDVQLRNLENGAPEPPGEIFIDRPAFKEALIQVSKVRLEQTVFAEYPQYRKVLMKLEREKTLQTPETLAQIWNASAQEALNLASTLVEIGFFERRGTREAPEFWVPFLYRDSLDMVQGTAETDIE